MNYIVNNYRTRKLGEKYILTTDHGSFCILDERDLSKLKSEKFDEEFKKKLEEKEIILTEKNIGESAARMFLKNSFLYMGTSLHIMVVTARCNMRCAYCHASSRPKNEKNCDMSQKTAEKTVDFIFQTPSPKIRIEFQGGEPLLNWTIIEKTIEYANNKNKDAKKELLFSLVTNLSLMDDEKMEYLIRNKIDITTSLDGPKELHDYNRKLSGASNHEQVRYWIDRLQKKYSELKEKPKINALVTLTRKSISQPEKIIDEYIDAGLKGIHLRSLSSLGVANTSWDKIGYSAEEFIEFWKEAMGHIGKKKKEGIQISERMAEVMTIKIGSDIDPNYGDLRSPCAAAIGQLLYDHDGKIYTCDEARMIGEDLFQLGDVFKDNYTEIVCSDKACAVVSASINDQYICEACAYKPYCGLCPVCNYAEQGSIIAKITETQRCKIHKAQFDWIVQERFINPEKKK